MEELGQKRWDNRSQRPAEVAAADTQAKSQRNKQPEEASTLAEVAVVDDSVLGEELFRMLVVATFEMDARLQLEATKDWMAAANHHVVAVRVLRGKDCCAAREAAGAWIGRQLDPERPERVRAAAES